MQKLMKKGDDLATKMKKQIQKKRKEDPAYKRQTDALKNIWDL